MYSSVQVLLTLPPKTKAAGVVPAPANCLLANDIAAFVDQEEPSYSSVHVKSEPLLPPIAKAAFCTPAPAS